MLWYASNAGVPPGSKSQGFSEGNWGGVGEFSAPQCCVPKSHKLSCTPGFCGKHQYLTSLWFSFPFPGRIYLL